MGGGASRSVGQNDREFARRSQSLTRFGMATGYVQREDALRKELAALQEARRKEAEQAQVRVAAGEDSWEDSAFPPAPVHLSGAWQR